MKARILRFLFARVARSDGWVVLKEKVRLAALESQGGGRAGAEAGQSYR